MVIQEIKDHNGIKTSKPTHLLIVDDDQDILASIKDVLELEFENCSIDVASNVKQAKLLAAETKPDIALLDIKLGQDNGLDLIPELKSIYPDIACIMMTAYRDNKYTVKAVRFGANDYLYKPVQPHELIQRITRLLEHQCIKREIAEADRRFHTVFEQTTQWLFIIDKEARLLDANQTAIDFISETKAAVLGKVFWTTPWFTSSVETQEIIQQGFTEVNALTLFNTDLKIIDAEKNEQTFNIYMKPVSDDESHVEQILVECRNITERKKAEEEIKVLNTQLESRVKERTIELEKALVLLTEENKIRKIAEEQAVKANSAKSEFLSRMSHELYTPMNAILGFGQILNSSHETLSEDQQSYVTEILTAGNHLLVLINEILELTEIESETLEVSMEQVSLGDLITSGLSIITPLAEARKISLVDNISGSGYIINANAARIKQVLLILLKNAVKYNSHEGTISLNAEIVDKGQLRISISDTGKGITKEDIDKLFVSFERVDDKFNVSGVGIGLVTAKKLLELMGGNIGVDSVLAKGSTFWVEIGLITNDEITKIDNKQNSNQDKVILYIDDDLVNLDLVSNVLDSASSHSVILVDNAIEGLKIAEEKQPDLILMDINMPIMNGFEALAALQKNKTIQHIPVVALSGNKTEDDIAKGKAAGFKEYLGKPFRIKELLNAIEEYAE